MKINEFIETMNKNKLQYKSIESVAKLINAKSYIPVLRKRQLAELVYNTSTKIENGIVVVDSLSKYLIFTMLMITEYTDLEFTVDENGVATSDAIAEYDMLCEAGLIDVVLACFEKDYARSNEILNYTFKDYLDASNNIEAIVASVASKINSSLDILTESLKDKIDDFDLDLNNLDFDSVKNLLGILNGENN